MKKIKVIILRTAGTNCDEEAQYAFNLCGAEVERVHINELLGKKKSLSDYHILTVPGGFTYGDDIAAGKILANELKYKLSEEMEGFVGDGKLVIGICNGFQILVKAGFLPASNGKREQTVTLTWNDSGKFEDRWIYLRKVGNDRCIFTRGVDKLITLPVAHSEGKFIARDEETLKTLEEKDQVVFQYVDQEGNPAQYPFNPNGSMDDIAGICDPTGRIFGLMPHPERHAVPTQNPLWTREGLKEEGDGLIIFRNALEFARKNL
jgi:phosphoribosylformylglycinamidine synthase